MDALKNFWRRWLGISRATGNILGHIVLTIFYFTVMLPFSIGVTLFGDPLQVKEPRWPFWQPRTDAVDNLVEAQRQF